MDGSGKSTQINLLKESQIDKKVKVMWARGGYTPFFKAIKRLIKLIISLFINKSAKNTNVNLNKKKKLRSRLFQNDLFVRIWLLISIFDLGIYLIIYSRYLRLRGFLVISDRCHVDTQIDFTLRFKKQFNPNGFIWRLFVAIVPNPDIAYLCLISPKASIERSKMKNDKYTDSYQHLENRHSLYKTLPLKTDWHWHELNCTNPIEEIHLEIKNQINHLYENFNS